MKIKLAFFSAIALIFFGLTACEADKQELLVGKWNIEKYQIGDESIPKEQLKGSYFQFNEDKTFLFNMMGSTVKGTWKISSDNKSLVTKSSTDKNDSMIKIEGVDDKRLILQEHVQNMTNRIELRKVD